MKSSGIGGQAVIEGVMMRNKDEYAIAVRKPDDTIIVEKEKTDSKTEKYKLFQLPILRGILNFIESLVMGMKVLTFSASFYEEEEELEPSKIEKSFSKIFKDKAESVAMGITVFISIVMAIAIFILLPYFIAELIGGNIKSPVILTLIEGAIRISIFILYIFLISKMEDIQRLFMYHGAEHKSINCIEKGYELTVENVRWQSREHRRCGTSFIFLVMFVSIIFFMFIRVDTIWLRVIIRLLLVPVIAGVSYEFIKLAGRSESKIVNILSKPGMLLQKFTTGEPDDDMIEVAIASVNAVFDWKTFVEDVEVDKKNPAIEFVDNFEEFSNNSDMSNTNDSSSSVEVGDDVSDIEKITNKYDEDDEILKAVELILKEKQI